MARYEIPAPPTRRIWPLVLIALAILAFIAARSICSYIVEYNGWREMGQVSTWLSLLVYSLTPASIAIAITFVVLFVAHALGMKFAGVRLRSYPRYAKISTAVVLLVAIVLGSGIVDTWTVVRYFGGRHVAGGASEWTDPVFGHTRKFYLFDLPFYGLLRVFLVTLAIAAALVYWLTARVWQLRDTVREAFRDRTEAGLDLRTLGLTGGLESRFLRGVAAVFLLALAFRFFLGRYEMLWNEHGFMVGIDYVDENWRLPLQWLLMATCVLSAVAVGLGRWVWSLSVVAALLIRAIVPAVVAGVYVRPNEITIERPYIERHIQATRSAYALDRRIKEGEFKAKLEARFDPAKNQAILSNVRLWDWQAFHDTVTQMQALRSYYRFADTDVDRYMIDGQLRQLLLTPRELDINQLVASAQAGWPNTHLIYTHGFGLVVAEANRITADGLPVLFIQDAPPVVNTPSLKLTRPELYYSEVAHEPIFVHTKEKEFDYPAGADNVFARYQGKGGFPVSSLGVRLAAAISEADPNILLTSSMTDGSRMMIRRTVKERVAALASYITWENDPYLVITESGRLVWTIDGYTTSDAHPYAHRVDLGDVGTVNYMRNAVKATVDAYDGDTHFYVFDPGDPIISAYRQLFPRLFQPFSEMPPDLRRHTRYPETFFRVQAEVYRTFHMRDPQAFYNKEDLWDVARTVRTLGKEPEPMAPTYVVASLPGEDTAEFLLILPFTPRNKDNMIGLMVARCDGEHLGDVVVLQLSKQELIFGPMQIEARINQDQTISKDLTLWNQQGSQVLRGQMLVLPIADTFLYVEPLYIQSSAAKMPQLKKIVLAMGNLLIYTDTYDQALAPLSNVMQSGTIAAPPPAPGSAPPPKQLVVPSDQRLESIREHLRRYRQFAGEGRWAEAGKELEAIEAEVNRR